MENSTQKPGVARGRKSRKAKLGLMALALGLTGVGIAAPAAKSTLSNGATGKRSWFQIGKASWYGGRFNGKKTATGEKFDQNALTCAHRSLPLGSWVRVTNLLNKKIAFLRVNDRGPMSGGLVVDLSYGAAQKLGINGLGKVKIESVHEADVAMYGDSRESAKWPMLVEIASTADGVPVLPPVVAER